MPASEERGAAVPQAARAAQHRRSCQRPSTPSQSRRAPRPKTGARPATATPANGAMKGVRRR
eukprot:4871613-Lingulodinium_polyedra.AAC.1